MVFSVNCVSFTAITRQEPHPQVSAIPDRQEKGTSEKVPGTPLAPGERREFWCAHAGPGIQVSCWSSHPNPNFFTPNPEYPVKSGEPFVKGAVVGTQGEACHGSCFRTHLNHQQRVAPCHRALLWMLFLHAPLFGPLSLMSWVPH